MATFFRELSDHPPYRSDRRKKKIKMKKEGKMRISIFIFIYTVHLHTCTQTFKTLVPIGAEKSVTKFSIGEKEK